jgi:hypothetical protein
VQSVFKLKLMRAAEVGGTHVEVEEVGCRVSCCVYLCSFSSFSAAFCSCFFFFLSCFLFSFFFCSI